MSSDNPVLALVLSIVRQTILIPMMCAVGNDPEWLLKRIASSATAIVRLGMHSGLAPRVILPINKC